MLAIAALLMCLSHAAGQRTVIGIRGAQFTVNGQATYTANSGFPGADPSIAGTLLNVRAVQAIFDDANYPQQGSKLHPYDSPKVGPIVFDYPDSPFSSERNVAEFLATLPVWRQCGLLAFTVNLQGGGPTDGNFGKRLQPHLNSGFDPTGNLKPSYAARLKRVIDTADKLGMVVIVGFFYQGSEQYVEVGPEDAYVKEAVRQAASFLKALPNRNVLIEIANEISPTMYTHPSLQPDRVADLVRLAQDTVSHQIPVSFSWVGDPPENGSKAAQALAMVDYIMFHTNRQSPDGVLDRIHAYRRSAGDARPLLVNEDGISSFNLQAATREHVGWGYYDQGLNNYRDGFQSPPVNWGINTLAKWLFFDQVARLTGSPALPRPPVSDQTVLLKVIGIEDGGSIKHGSGVEAIISGAEDSLRIARVEFFVDDIPYSYSRIAPYRLGNAEVWDMHGVSPGRHLLRVVAYMRGGPVFTELATMDELPFVVSN
jgi:hypothetical protein